MYNTYIIQPAHFCSYNTYKKWPLTNFELCKKQTKNYALMAENSMTTDMSKSHLKATSVSLPENTSSRDSSTHTEELEVPDYTSSVDGIYNNSVSRINDRSCKPINDYEYYDTLNNYSDTHHIRDIVESNLMECPSDSHSATGSSLEVQHPLLDSSSSSTENAQKSKQLHSDEIAQYENEVLSDPFYESDCGSDGNDLYEFVEKRIDKSNPLGKKDNEESHSNYLEENNLSADKIRHPLPHTISTSNHYFIDASTLNDEVEALTTDIIKDQPVHEKLQSFESFSADALNVPEKSIKDQFHKFTLVKTPNLQSGYKTVTTFEQELKLAEYFQPPIDACTVKKEEPVSLSKVNQKSIDKESSAVEVKEADSAESTHPSPCPDNNTKIDLEGNDGGEHSDDKEKKSNDELPPTTSSDQENASEDSKNVTKEIQQPLLIRRNTFELDSNNEKLSVLRQEYERRQGNLIFQSAIPQYSGHCIDENTFFNLASEQADPSIDDSLKNFSSGFEIPTNVQYQATSYLPLNKYKNKVDQNPVENTTVLPNKINTSNTVYPVTKSTSDKVVFNCYTEIDDAIHNCSTSLPVTLNYTLEKFTSPELMKRTKRDEATPIISGGVSSSDYSKPTDSPTVRRKTESTPIVSGGSVIMNNSKGKSSKMSSSMTAWIVDMSDCAGSASSSATIDSPHAGISQSFSASDTIKESACSTANEKHGSLGFFVNLKNVDSKKNPQIQDDVDEKKKRNRNGKPYCEFYIDISNKNDTSKIKKQERSDTSTNNDNPVKTVDKKNIFSMFINLSDKVGDSNVKMPEKTNLTSFSDKSIETRIDETQSTENSGAAVEDQGRQKFIKERTERSVFMFIESDSPVVRRRTLSSSRPVFKRHSWNVDKTQHSNNNGHTVKDLTIKKEHKRAHSLSVDQRDLKKLQSKSSSSNHSLNDTVKTESLSHEDTKSLQEVEINPNNNMDTSMESGLEYDARDTPPNSHIEIIDEEFCQSLKHHDYKTLLTGEATKESEESDAKLCQGNPSETLSWHKTRTESNSEQAHSISNDNELSLNNDSNDYEVSDFLSRKMQNISCKPQIVPYIGNKISETHKSLNKTIKKIECELKGPEYEKLDATYNGQTSISKTDKGPLTHNLKYLHLDSRKMSSKFVRLSDLDKTPGQCHNSEMLVAKENKATYRMSSSIPETSWIESKLVMSRTNDPVRTLSRKYTSIMSTSLPSKQKSPLEDLTGDGEGEGTVSESDISSMQSSMGRSGAEGSTEETETSSYAGGKPYNRLGEDLLRMFLEEINPDVTIDVAGRRIKAHKCILSSRCQYFAAILSGGWIESAGNVISLQGYSYNAVHFALCHIYSGESNIPDSISIVELATLADMLCLEGLKEVIGYTLKVKYCHFFHKPCQVCAIGVLECMPLAATYGLDEVYRKSLRWITKHFVRIWPCKAFATLPKELMEKCYLQHIVHMSTDNILQTMMDCDKLLATLPNVRWAEPVFRMVSNLFERSMKFLSDNFAGVLSNENFQALGRDLTWNINHLEDNFLAAAERLPPEQACKSYSKLHKMLTSAQTENTQAKLKWGSLFNEFLKKIQVCVEKCLVRDAARAARSTTWLKMDLELRRRIQELACLVILPHETSKRQSRHSNFLKEAKTQSTCSTNRNLDLKRVKMAISEHNDRTMKQISSTQPARKVLNKPKSDPVERKMQEDKQTTVDTSVRPKSWPNKIEVKSRYLEPRNKFLPKEAGQTHQDKVALQRRKITISSSDSSRTSSPATKRVAEKKPAAKLKLPMKKDVKALSTDNLAESNATRSNNKKAVISKSCGITRPESPSFKQKGTEIDLSADSLAETKNKPPVTKKKTTKMDTSMSTDSLMTEVTTTSKSNPLHKLSPTLGKGASKSQIYDRVKKNSSPMQQRSPLMVTRRPPRSLENSTAASRSRAAAISAYHGSPSLRRNLLDAAKTPDISSKSFSNVYRTTGGRQVSQSTTALPVVKREKKESGTNQQGSDSSSKRSSPKSSSSKPSKSTAINKKTPCKIIDDKIKTKCHNEDVPKQLTVGSRSGTFLKDEPTILKKTDIKSTQIST